MTKFLVVIISLIMAVFIVVVLLPTPNIAGAGTAMMCIMIFLTVFFKVIIEFVLSKRRKRIADHRDDKHDR